jgi:hypothetical protein
LSALANSSTAVSMRAPGWRIEGVSASKPAGPVAADPPVQAVAGVTVGSTERAGMFAGRDRAHDSAARLGRQVRIQ